MLDQLKSLLHGYVAIPEERLQLLLRYHQLLLQWNERMDLTNVPPEEMALRHYADSLLPLQHPTWFEPDSRLIDVGTGAGFPGMPLAIARPDMQVVLLDALNKRCQFLSAVVEELALPNVQVLHARAEDAAKSALRAGFDLAVARAVAPIGVLAEYLLPFVKVGGHALCWKGPSVEEEMHGAARALNILGGKADERMPLPLPGYQYCVQAIKKQAATPAKYPRKAGTPARNPL